MLWKVALLLTALVAAVSFPAYACYSGLAIIPTAETVGEGYYGIEPQLDGPLDSLSAETRLLNTEVGIGPRFEGGVDLDLSEDAPTRLLLNAKWLLAEGGERGPAVALGVCNVGRHLVSSPYAVATQELGAGLRGHAGVIGIEGDHHWFAGLDKALESGLLLMADYTEGAGNYSSLGAGLELGGPWSAMAALQFPNTQGDETLFTVHLVFTAPYRPVEGGE